MVSFNVYRSTASGAYVEGVCLATDEKPVVGIANGSILFAVDTTSGETTRYMYDQNSMSWIEATLPGGSGGSGGGGGGGGGTGGGSLFVHLTGENMTADKTFGEIETALSNGVMVFFMVPGPDGSTSYATITSFRPGDAEGGLLVAIAAGSTSLPSRNTAPTASDYPFFAAGGQG